MSRQVDHAFDSPNAPVIVEFTDEQQAEIRDALFAAQMSLLAAITREATREESYDGPRNIGRLTASLSSLRAINAGGGWFAYGGPVPFSAIAEGEFDDPAV